MLKNTLLLFALVLGTAGQGPSALAGEEPVLRVEKKHLIALKTDEFELAETDVSDLALGESETIVTENGKTIDILRTEDGIELYVDGVLQEFDLPEDLRDEYAGSHEEIVIICSDDDDCDEHAVLHEEIEITCSEDGACDEMVWIAEDTEASELEEDHEKVIIIKRKTEHD